MAPSVVLLGGGFAMRVILLHRTLVRGILVKTRRACGEWFKAHLLVLWKKLERNCWAEHLARRMIYHPLLIIMLYVHIHMDLFTSKFVEVKGVLLPCIDWNDLTYHQVWWLIFSFALGVIRLVDQQADSLYEGPLWTFGQVLPVLLLVAPLLLIVSSFQTLVTKSGRSAPGVLRTVLTLRKNRETGHSLLWKTTMLNLDSCRIILRRSIAIMLY